MKKLALIVLALAVVVGIVIAQTTVTTEEKDAYIEKQTKLDKIDTAIQSLLDTMNAEIEVEENKYKAAIAVISATYQPQIDTLRAEKTTLEAGE